MERRTPSAGAVTKVLFICKGNVGRSQMAEAIFNSLAGGKANASSAGVKSGEYGGRRLSDIAPVVVKCMEGINLDVSHRISKVLTRDMFDNAELVVSMVEDKALLPEYVRDSGKVVYWSIENPKDMDLAGTTRIRNQIYERVSTLVERISSAETRAHKEKRRKR